MKPGRRLCTGRAAVAGCLALAVAAAGTANADAVASGAAHRCRAVSSIGRWERIAVPKFPAAPVNTGLQVGRHLADGWDAVSEAVDPAAPDRMFMSDGYVVLRSTDGGCSWHSVFSLYPDGIPTDGSTEVQPWVDPNYMVRHIAIAGTGAVPHVYLALTDFVNTPTLQPVYLAASDDGGSHWAVHPVTANAGPVGRYQAAARDYLGDLMASPSSPRTVYYGTVFYGDALTGASSTYTLLVSHDAGATWRITSATPYATGDMSEFVDPFIPSVVWRGYDTFNGSHPQLVALRSRDYGRTFHPVLTGAPPGAQVYDPPYVSGLRDGARTCVLSRSSQAAFVTTTTGKRWTRLPGLPALDRRSGAAYLEGAACVGKGAAVGLAGYQPQRYKAPPFTRSALYRHAPGRRQWKRLAPLPLLLADGSLSVSGPTSRPVVYWFGSKRADLNGAATPSDFVWLRYRL